MILHMQNYCELLLLLIFIISMLGSLTRSDANSTYSLFTYILLASYRFKVSLKNILTVLIIVTIIMTLGDAWAFIIMLFQQIQVIGHIFGYAIIIIQIILKIFLIVMLACWRQNTSEKGSEPIQKQNQNNNSNQLN